MEAGVVLCIRQAPETRRRCFRRASLSAMRSSGLCSFRPGMDPMPRDDDGLLRIPPDLQSQSPAAISRAIMDLAFIITSSPEVSIWP